MKSAAMNRTTHREIAPDSITRTMPTAPRREPVETWSTPEAETRGGRTDRLYLRDATLTVDYRGIIRSTIAGIEGSGGPISMMWIELGSEGDAPADPM